MVVLAISSVPSRAAEPAVSSAVNFESSVPVRLLPPAAGNANVSSRPPVNPLEREPDRGEWAWTRGRAPLDPLITQSQNSGHTPPLDLVFDGTANPFACGPCDVPDTIGAVGKDHYIQMVNATKVAIFSKDGSAAGPPFDLGSLWSSGTCTADTGDPVVLYDQFADRWVMMQLGSFGSPFLCLAISQTGDPLGSYYLYTFNTTQYPDYFKFGVWRNAYYGSAFQSTYAAFAFNRAKMLVGDPSAEVVRFTGETNFLLPANADGTMTPGGGGLFYTFKDDQFHGGQDRIEVFRLDPDFANSQNSTFGLIDTIPIAPFTYTVCGFFNFDCIPQKGTSQKVNALGEFPMQRLAWRKWNDATSLVGAFTVGGGHGSAGAAVRWFELRRSNGHWTLYQEGTQDLNDGLDRWMGSIGMDRQGNIALGYSVSSPDVYPSIRYATRRNTDPLGTLSPERVLKAGAGSQTGGDGWGDYSAMTIDPLDGCQFWYTNEYYQTSSASTWKTAIGAFHLCGSGGAGDAADVRGRVDRTIR